MNINLEKKLYKKYPKLFRQKDLPMNQTAMCWGLQCGDGWYKLIDQVCKYLQNMINWNNWPQVEFTTVKEKFGGLRMYWDLKNKTEKEYKKSRRLKKLFKTFEEYIEHVNWVFRFVDGVISFAEQLSYSICESCGKEGKNRNIFGWIHTLCDDCTKEYKKRFTGDD